MIINISGLKGHAMPVDLNIEHQIGYLKVCIIPHCILFTNLTFLYQALFVAKGFYLSWERIADISASIHYLQNVKKQVGVAMSTGYHGSTHSSPDNSGLVWRVANKVQELNLQVFLFDREGNSAVKPTTNILGGTLLA